jgi:hypothetical protein
MRVRPESVTHLVVKLFNVKSKFDYIDKKLKKIGDCKQRQVWEAKVSNDADIFFGNNFFGLSGFFKGQSVKGETNLILI